jgi:hypothetical protein
MDKSMFGGIFIPREVMQDQSVSSTAKILYGLIQSLDGKHGCFASNDWLAETMHCSKETIRAGVKELEDKSYVSRFISPEGKRTIRTCGTRSFSPTEKSADPTEKSVAPPTEKSVAYNTNNSNTIKDIKDEHSELFSDKEFSEAWESFKNYRKERKKPLTKRAEQLLLAKFKGVNKSVLVTAINNSIMHSWIGVFPESVKPQQTTTNHIEF